MYIFDQNYISIFTLETFETHLDLVFITIKKKDLFFTSEFAKKNI